MNMTQISLPSSAEAEHPQSDLDRNDNTRQMYSFRAQNTVANGLLVHWSDDHTKPMLSHGARTHVMAATYDGDRGSWLYSDGDFSGYALSADLATATAAVGERLNFLIGARTDVSGTPSAQYDGYIEEVVIFNKWLSRRDLDRLYYAANSYPY